MVGQYGSSHEPFMIGTVAFRSFIIGAFNRTITGMHDEIKRLVDAAGKLYAHGTTTCLVFDFPQKRAA